MKSIEQKIITIDRLIYAFLILFVITLNNSIFLSQIGFFATYILIGVKSFYLKENPFKKNDFSFYIGILVFVFIVTSIFSISKEEAFLRTTKKILLIPIFYSIIYFINDRKKAEELFKFYLYGALATIIIYLGFSIHHYLYHLYSLEQKGPSPFQYVMTAGGLMSFVAVFSFAFLIHEKDKLKSKLFYSLSFMLSFLAVLASFTRAAWLGMFIGILVILIMSKKLKFILGVVSLLIFYLFINQNQSFVEYYDSKSYPYKLMKQITTNGKASDFAITPSKEILLSDYNNGVLVIKNQRVIQRIPTSAPVTNLINWNDSVYCAFSIDGRFFVIEKENNYFKLSHSFFSPGKTAFFKTLKNNLFVADEDSGLTIYTNPTNKNQFVRYPQIKLNNFTVVDSFLVGYDFYDQNLKLFTMNKSGFISKNNSIKIMSGVFNLFDLRDGFLFQTDKKLYYYLIENNRLNKKEEFNILGGTKSKNVDSLCYLLTTSGVLHKISQNQNNELNITLENNFKKEINDFDFYRDTLIITFAKRNRLSSIYDLNHITNFERINIWRTGIKIFKDHWLLGIGDLDLQKIYKVYKEPYLKENFGHMHNNIINWLVTFGIIGTAFIFLFIFKVIYFYYYLYKKIIEEPFVSSFALGSLASLICFLFTGLGEYNFGDQEIMTVMWFILGLNYAYYQIITLEKKSNA